MLCNFSYKPSLKSQVLESTIPLASADRVGYPLTLRATVAGDASGISLLMTAEDVSDARGDERSGGDDRKRQLSEMLGDLVALLKRICDAAVDFRHTPRELRAWLWARDEDQRKAQAAVRAARSIFRGDDRQVSSDESALSIVRLLS